MVSGIKVFAFLFCLAVLATTANAALTPNQILFANGTYIYSLNKATNTTISVNTGETVVKVSASKDGNNYIVASTGFHVYTYSSSLALLHTITLPVVAASYFNTTGCERYGSYYYCGFHNATSEMSGAKQLDLNGIQTYTYEVFSDGGSVAPASIHIASNGLLYVEGHDGGGGNVTTEAVFNISTNALIGNYSLALVVSGTYPKITYDSTTNKLIRTNNMGSAPATADIYNLNSNGSIASLSGTYTAVYAIYPFKTSTGSYITSNATGIYEFDGTNYYNYTFAFTTMLPMKTAEYNLAYSPSSNPLLEIQSSGGSAVCDSADAVPATCSFTNSVTGLTYTIESNNNQEYSENADIAIGVRSLMKGYEVINSVNKCAYGGCKPYDTCWASEQAGVGTSLSSLDYTLIQDDDQRQGFNIILKSSNMMFDNYGGLVHHWYALGQPGGINQLGVMAGKYITPIIISATPEYELDPAAITISYSSPSSVVFPQNLINDFDNTQIWKNNIFNTALAYNTTHYYVSTWNYSDDEQGWVRNGSYSTFAQLNVTLSAYGLTNAAMAELLADWDYSLPFDYVTAGNILTLKGFAWGETNPTTILTADTFMKPNCASTQHATTFNCNSNLIRQEGAYASQSLCDIPNNVVRWFDIDTPSIHLFPIVNANITLSNYYNGSALIPNGTYNYSCSSVNSSQIVTGNITLQTSGKTTLPIRFNDINQHSIGYLLSVFDAAGNPAKYITIATQYATQTTNASGQVEFWGITPNQILNVTATFLSKTIEYIGGNGFAIGDNYNSQRYSESGYCAGFDGLYRYNVDMSPTFRNITWAVKCNAYLMPNSDIYIDGAKVADTGTTGYANFSTYKTHADSGFNVTIVSEYGVYSHSIKDIISGQSFPLENCSTDGGVAGGFDLGNILNSIFNPMFLCLIATILLCGAAVWLTGSIELGLATLPVGIGLFALLGIIPAYLFILAIIPVALIFATVIWKG